MRKSETRKRKGNSVFVVLLQTLSELLATFKYGLIEELEKVAVVLQILIPIVIARTDLSTPKMLIVSCVLVVCVKYIREVGYKHRGRTGRAGQLNVMQGAESIGNSRKTMKR